MPFGRLAIVTEPAARDDNAAPQDNSDQPVGGQGAEQQAAEQQAVEPQEISDEDALVLTTVAVPFGDRLTTYDAEGSGIIWRVPATLTAKVAGGELPRREAGEGVSAQCIVVDQKRMLLKGLEDDEWPAVLLDEKALPVTAHEWQERLRQMLVAAARRGEAVIFARAGLIELDQPCVRACVVKDDDGEWVSVVEAFPAVTVDGWSDAEAGAEVARKTAPVADNDFSGAVGLMLMAAQTFSPGPEQIGLFFEDAPDGPWQD